MHQGQGATPFPLKPASGRQGSCGQFVGIRREAQQLQVLQQVVVMTGGGIGHKADGEPPAAGQVHRVNRPWEGR